MADQQFCLRWNNHQSTLISVFDNLLENNILVDCTLAAEGRYIKAHKVVLCACSPYLELVLSQHSERHPILILKDVKFQELRSMMDYMYKGEVNISQEHLETFLKTAESLQIKGLTDCGNKDAFKDASSSSQMKRHDSSRKPTPTQPVSSTSPVVPFVHSPALSEANVRQMSSSSHIDLQLDASPSSRERSLSPVQRKKKRARRTSQTDSEHYDIPETAPVQLQSTSINNVPSSNPVLSAVNNVGGEHSLNADDISGYAALSTETIKKDKIDCNQDVIVPKTEFFDDLNEDGVEDLTMDDEIDNMDGVAGPSHSAENSNQGYGWPMSGERSSADEMFPNQDVSGIQQDGQAG